jgi:hypothetical protein
MPDRSYLGWRFSNLIIARFRTSFRRGLTST